MWVGLRGLEGRYNIYRFQQDTLIKTTQLHISDLQAKVNIRRSLKDNPSRSRNEFGIKFNKTTIKNSLNLDKSIPFCEKLAILKSYDKLSKENKTFLPELANDLKTKIKQSRGAILKQKVRYKNGLKIIKLRKTRHSQAYFTDKALSKILIKKGKQISKASPLGRKSAVAIPQSSSSSSITRVPTNKDSKGDISRLDRTPVRYLSPLDEFKNSCQKTKGGCYNSLK